MSLIEILILLSKVKDKIEEVAQDKEITLSELLDVIKTAVDDSGLGDIKVIDKEHMKEILKKLK